MTASDLVMVWGGIPVVPQVSATGRTDLTDPKSLLNVVSAGLCNRPADSNPSRSKTQRVELRLVRFV